MADGGWMCTAGQQNVRDGVEDGFFRRLLGGVLDENGATDVC